MAHLGCVSLTALHRFALQAHAIIELLSPIRALPLDRVPALTFARSLCGEGWLDEV